MKTQLLSDDGVTVVGCLITSGFGDSLNHCTSCHSPNCMKVPAAKSKYMSDLQKEKPVSTSVDQLVNRIRSGSLNKAGARATRR